MTQPASIAPDFAEQLRADIVANRIQLPTLPEVALRVRDAVESENTSAAEVAEIVTQDPAVAARLLQVANSALYRARNPIDNVQMAITRMGVKLVRNLVISLAMKQIFQATSDALDDAFREIWTDSLEVAAVARVFSDNVDKLEPEQAMLAGLVHNCGNGSSPRACRMCPGTAWTWNARVKRLTTPTSYWSRGYSTWSPPGAPTNAAM